MATEEEMRAFVNGLSGMIDQSLNGPPREDMKRQVGYILLLFPMDGAPDSPATLTTNSANREEIGQRLKAQGEAILTPDRFLQVS